MNTFPVLFIGHGSPMLALEESQITKELQRIGAEIKARFGAPKAILSISAHWYLPGTYVQSANPPKQVYDMYGFPKELYEVTYPVNGYAPLTERVQELLGKKVSVNDSWGIDHGTWTVLCHLFPEADIPVVQLSVNSQLSPEDSYALGKELIALREEGYLIIGSGNIVHNLRAVEWNNEQGSPAAERFNSYIKEAVEADHLDAVVHYNTHPDAAYAVPTLDHYLPLLYCLGAANGNPPLTFNNTCNLGSISMTSFIFQ